MGDSGNGCSGIQAGRVVCDGAGAVKAILSDPRLINFVLLALYSGNVVRWTVAGSWADATYWLGALIITVAVTFGYHR